MSFFFRKLTISFVEKCIFPEKTHTHESRKTIKELFCGYHGLITIHYILWPTSFLLLKGVRIKNALFSLHQVLFQLLLAAKSELF